MYIYNFTNGQSLSSTQISDGGDNASLGAATIAKSGEGFAVSWVEGAMSTAFVKKFERCSDVCRIHTKSKWLERSFGPI